MKLPVVLVPRHVQYRLKMGGKENQGALLQIYAVRNAYDKMKISRRRTRARNQLNLNISRNFLGLFPHRRRRVGGSWQGEHATHHCQQPLRPYYHQTMRLEEVMKKNYPSQLRRRWN